jgi:predicted DNA-binding transcriptional regulator AlpA
MGVRTQVKPESDARHMTSERRGHKIPEWGALYGFGREKAYKLIRDGEGPRTTKCGGTYVIFAEDDEAWRAQRRAEAEAQSKAAAA